MHLAKNQNGLLVLMAAGLSLCLVLGFVYVLHAATPFNAVELPGESSVRARLWSPQGWKFFTRNPREDTLHIYSRKRDSAWSDASLGPNTSLAGWFGLNRKPRAQGIEYGLLLYGISATSWTKCDGGSIDCLERAPIASAVYNRTPRPTLCGTVGFVLRPPVPWAWAGITDDEAMPAKALKLVVKC
jgi:antimicrobial peptide system SdpA family protein